MNVVLSVCGKVIVNDQGNLLDVNPTSLTRKRHLKLEILTLETVCLKIIVYMLMSPIIK